MKPQKKILMISTDAKILEEGSAAFLRMKDYAGLFAELRIIILTSKGGSRQIAENASAEGTGSSSKLFRMRDAVSLGRRIIAENGFAADDSIITTQDPFETGLVGRRLSLETGIPLHVQVHTDFLSPHFSRGSFLNMLRVYVSKSVLRRAQGVRVVSARIKETLSKNVCYGLPAAKIAVLPIWVDKERFSRADGSPIRAKYRRFSKIVLIASRLTKEKNIPLALIAFKSALAENPGAGLLIIGDGPEKRRIEKLASALGIAKAVAFEGWVADLAPYYKAADLFLVTSSYEGYGMTIIEAAYAGTPIVSTDVGIAPDVLPRENVVPVGNAALLATTVSKMLRHERGEAPQPAAVPKDEYLRKYQESLLLY